MFYDGQKYRELFSGDQKHFGILGFHVSMARFYEITCKHNPRELNFPTIVNYSRVKIKFAELT